MTRSFHEIEPLLKPGRFIPGYEVAETTDENPARVTLIQHLTTAFLRSTLLGEDGDWKAAATALEEGPDPLGRCRASRRAPPRPPRCPGTGHPGHPVPGQPGPPHLNSHIRASLITPEEMAALRPDLLTTAHREEQHREHRNDRAALRFLTITGQRFEDGQSALEMFSPAVDAAWHELLGTPQYKVLCEETTGRPIGHTANNGHGPISWVTAYEEACGPLPEIWFTDTDTDGNVDRDTLARYRETGTVVAESAAVSQDALYVRDATQGKCG
jgi:hypothetical protein